VKYNITKLRLNRHIIYIGLIVCKNHATGFLDVPENSE